MKSLVIVGNGPIHHDLGNKIDSFEYVIRFNDCKNYNINSGKKTDVLILNNTPKKNKTIHSFLKNSDKNEMQYLILAKQIWFVRPNSFFFNQHFSKLLNINKEKSIFYKIFNYKMHNKKIEILEDEIKPTLQKIDVADEIIIANNISKDKVSKITDKFYSAVCSKLNIYESNSIAIMPSTGILGVEMILNNKSFNDYEKYIVGFNWQGWEGHPWEKEKALMQYYIDNGILKLLT